MDRQPLTPLNKIVGCVLFERAFLLIVIFSWAPLPTSFGAAFVGLAFYMGAWYLTTYKEIARADLHLTLNLKDKEPI